ncbi:alpha/beta hydrolase [Terrabacter sp. C0L_2]|uniref:alpha/beta hydrolase n=1 Tax=Terrabacter sp. C0L_2 TaxID=3108389 RepID=UPI002ED2B1B5|nr:alpha/beta hydrolase [Terrabacter sp. C0L_2]
MLNEDPRPDDLPDAPTGYAALPSAYPPPPPGADGATPPAGPGWFTGAAAAGGAHPGRSWVRPVLASVAVVAVIAVLALAVWRIGNPPPVAQPQPRTPASTASTSGSASPSPTAGTPTTGNPAAQGYPAALAAFYTQKLDWAPCSDNAKHRCATMEVPVDYAKPGGERFTLALRKAPATDPAKRLGSLVINPGGPGGSGVEYAQYASFVFSPAVRAAYDVVGFDPRGIGASSPVRCLTDSDMDLLFSADPTPDSPAERSTLLGDVDGVTKRCAARGGERAMHMSTTEVARDMDVMRVLLGDTKLNFFGGSYGTFLGAIYADTFPERVGRMVLDSAMSPNQTEQQEMTYDIQGFESSIDAFIAWCVGRSDCALGTDRAGARQKIVDLLDAVEKKGLTTSKPGLTTIGEGWVGFSIFMCLYSDSSWPTLNKGLAQAFTGKGDILLAKGMSVVERGITGDYAPTTYLQAMIPVRCADWPRASSDPSLVAEQKRAQAAHPLWARMTGELYDNCRTWPTAGRTPKGTTLAQGAGPILVIGNERDPATPIGGTKQLAKDLASGVLLTSDHDGHGTYYAGNSCVDSAVDGYLLRGTAPSDGTTC